MAGEIPSLGSSGGPQRPVNPEGQNAPFMKTAHQVEKLAVGSNLQATQETLARATPTLEKSRVSREQSNPQATSPATNMLKTSAHLFAIAQSA